MSMTMAFSKFRGENKNVKTDKTDDGHCVITKAHPGLNQSELQRQNSSVNINYLLILPIVC